MTYAAERGAKPLGIKAYGSIGHLPNSRMGPADHHCHPGQASICLERTRDKHDVIHVQEKLDGSCVSVARIDGEIVPLGRAGFTAISSPHEQHWLFHHWALRNKARFLEVLSDGERLCGEWLALAHGTRYDLKHEPFVVFDLMSGHNRASVEELEKRLAGRFKTPHLLHSGGPISTDAALALLVPDVHGALDPIEGLVYRVERKGKVDFLAKWVRQDKQDGKYFKEHTGQDIWNWRPAEALS